MKTPPSRASLITELATVEAEVAAFFGAISADVFTARPGTAWSPAEHLDHLNIAVSATARGFAMSRLVLRFRFGRSSRPCRTFDELRADYLARLSAGAGATGRFVPRPQPPGESPAETQRRLLARWQRVNERLRNALATWSERDLDRVRFPHPILGRIPARELIFFTIHHGPHHIAAARRRLPPHASPTSAARM